MMMISSSIDEKTLNNQKRQKKNKKKHSKSKFLKSNHQIPNENVNLFLNI